MEKNVKQGYRKSVNKMEEADSRKEAREAFGSGGRRRYEVDQRAR